MIVLSECRLAEHQLQHENARLKKVVAQLTLDVDIRKEINAKEC